MVILNLDKSQSILSYKYYIRPQSHHLYGKFASKSKHRENVQKILRVLALEGPMTTWEMAKVRFTTNNDKVRTKEKEYRRLLLGRTDRGVHSNGILDLNLVLVDSKTAKRNPGNKYRLSLYGILYCLDVMDFNEKEIDRIAKNYEVILPLVFGNWDLLKSTIGEHVYNISLLGKGLLFDNPNIIKIENVKFYELISYFNIKSNALTESFNEEKIGELISLWFFITLLYFPNLKRKTKNQDTQKYLRKILKKNNELNEWFSDFIEEVKTFYKQRLKIVNEISIV